MAYSRRLLFFDKFAVRDTNQADIFAGLNDVRPTCTSSGRGFLWVGDDSGCVHRLDRSQQIASFRSHAESVCHVHQFKHHDLLITIGIDEAGEEHLKVWNTAKWLNKPAPHCCRTTSTNPPGQSGTHVTCFFMDEELQFILLGHSQGHVQLLRGDVTRERQCKRHVLHTFPTAVTGLSLLPIDLNAPLQKQITEGRGGRGTDLQGPVVFATTEQCVMSFVLGRRDEVISKTVLDRFGASFNCSSLIGSAPGGPQFAVACRDAVYFYQWDGRGPCLATDGNKLALSVFKQYLVILKGSPGIYLSHAGVTQTDNEHSVDSMATLIIHDQQNKFIAGEFSFPGVVSMFVEWDGIYLLCLERTSDGQLKYTLIGLNEKSTAAKLEMLFSKKNFQMAIDIAKSQNFDQEELARILGRYADHLYKQKDYDAAIKEYVKTIGILEASFVIQRFLEGGHIAQLAYYLEALSNANRASSDHLILLLNCYARLQDKQKINEFVRNPISPNLNIPAALQVLRQANFPDAALQLAQQSGKFADRVGILVEDLEDYATALNDIATFPFDEALRAICNYGHLLIERHPKETLQLLDSLCSQPDASRINVHHFLKIFINNRVGLMQFLERYITTPGKTVKVGGVVDALLELILYELDRLKDSDSHTKEADRTRLSQLAMRLLRDEQLLYDDKKALLMCHRRGFFDGCIFLWEKLHLYDPLLKHYMSLEAHEKVIETCQRFGHETPKLWMTALRYFASKPDRADDLHDVVTEVDRLQLASPLVVLQILSETDAEHSCLLGTIRDYLLHHLESEANQITALREGVQKLRSETMRNREVVRCLNSQVKIFQQQKCALCHQSLEPPSVHFLCDHSYHKLCFENYASNDQHCPECAPKNRKLLAEVDISTSSITSSQMVEQLRNALNADLSLTAADLQDSSRASSPQLTKLLAARLSHAPFGLGAGLPRPQTPSGLSSNAIQMSVLHTADGQPKKHRTLSQSTLPRGSPETRSIDLNLTPTAQSSSVGYHSIDRRRCSDHSAKPSTNNPFGDSDTDDEQRTTVQAAKTHPSSGTDLGFVASSSPGQPSSNPFDG